MSTLRYQAYLLRLWQQQVQTQHTWRILLENVHTGERMRFSSLEELVEFLQGGAEPPPEAPVRETPSRPDV